VINKIYVKFINYIKENYKSLIFYFVILVVMLYPLPYYIYTSGGINNINNKINIDQTYHKKGSINYTFVNEISSTIPLVLLSYIIPDWNVVKMDDMKEDYEDVDIIKYRDRMILEESLQNATVIAYRKAEKQIELLNPRHYLIYISNNAITNLKIKDEILEVNGSKINNINDYSKIISDSNIGDNIRIKVKYNNKLEYKNIKVINENNKKMTGIYFITLYDMRTIPNISLQYGSNEFGSSSGLMLALGIYNNLINYNITKGLKIAGTGTIESDGSVGEIGSVYYKLKAAVNNKADIFFVPSGNNYKKALKYQKKYKYQIKIVAVKTFDEALNYLNEL
jgi:Lon-like protease